MGGTPKIYRDLTERLVVPLTVISDFFSPENSPSAVDNGQPKRIRDRRPLVVVAKAYWTWAYDATGDDQSSRAGGSTRQFPNDRAAPAAVVTAAR